MKYTDNRKRTIIGEFGANNIVELRIELYDRMRIIHLSEFRKFFDDAPIWYFTMRTRKLIENIE